MMPKFADSEAENILASLDKCASEIQQNYKSWGMPFEAAKQIVNVLDKTADGIEVAVFGKESFERRQVSEVTKVAKVIHRDADEPYMQNFANPMAPMQVESDEPYMNAYGDDQSSAVQSGKSTTGRPLVP